MDEKTRIREAVAASKAHKLSLGLVEVKVWVPRNGTVPIAGGTAPAVKAIQTYAENLCKLAGIRSIHRKRGPYKKTESTS